jgi:hypothetical protein
MATHIVDNRIMTAMKIVMTYVVSLETFAAVWLRMQFVWYVVVCWQVGGFCHIERTYCHHH